MGISVGDRIRWLAPEVINTRDCHQSLQGDLGTVLAINESKGLFVARFTCDRFGVDPSTAKAHPRLVELEAEELLWEKASIPAPEPGDRIIDDLLPSIEASENRLRREMDTSLSLTPVAEYLKGFHSSLPSIFTLKMGVFDGPELIGVLYRMKGGRVRWSNEHLERYWRFEIPSQGFDA
jgi:hypothetical protein